MEGNNKAQRSEPVQVLGHQITSIQYSEEMVSDFSSVVAEMAAKSGQCCVKRE